jgi:hypothetical protein
MASSSDHARALTLVVRAILHLLPLHYVRRRLNGPRQSLVMYLTSIQSGVDRCGVRSVRVQVLDRLGASLGWAKLAPSTSAICRAMRKLTAVMLEAVIERALAEVARTFGDRALIHGRRVVAIDGVRINSDRTPELARRLGRPKQGGDTRAHQPQALVVSAVCVVTKVQLAQEILRCDGSERAAARRLVRRLSTMGPMIVLLDRGYHARDLVALLHEHRISFVLRLSGGLGAWREVVEFTRKASVDQRIAVRVRGKNGTFRKISLRLIVTARAKRGRPRRNRTPQRMMLLTDLHTWKAQRVVALYHRRWDIETVFRENKRLLGATHFRARTISAFQAELHAYTIYRLLMALVLGTATAGVKTPRWDDPLTRRNNTPQIITIAAASMEAALRRHPTASQRLDRLLKEAWRDHAKRRPGRVFDRKCKGSEGRWRHRNESWRF